MPELGVNIDHVATVRQARRTYEPDPVWAAALAELGGADCITLHLARGPAPYHRSRFANPSRNGYSKTQSGNGL